MPDPAAFARALFAAFVLLSPWVSCWAIRRGVGRWEKERARV